MSLMCIVMALLGITLFITIARIFYVNRFRKNVRVNDLVHFYLHEERLPGIVTAVGDHTVDIEYLGCVYRQSIDLIYP